jgi:serine/threonine protein kinase
MEPHLPAGLCPGCGQVAGAERCTHCGVAVRVGPYRVRKVLGQRGAARTYLAREAEGLIVLKELSFSAEPTAATLQAFHQEARQLQSLTHPHIPRYLEMLQLGLGAETRLYLVQEFIEGTPLEAELAHRPYSEHEARELAHQVLDILRYLQGRSPQVFHGDLKPTNLVRRSDGALFLVDFGAGWVRGRASSGASHYTPPEQAGGELDVTTDLFALGVTLLEALSGQQQDKPRPAKTAMLVPRVDVSTALREFLGRLTSTDPALRFGSAEEALRELDSAQRAHPPRRSRRVSVALGTGAAVLLFGAGFLTGRLTQPTSRVASHYPLGAIPEPPAPVHPPSNNRAPPPPHHVDSPPPAPLPLDTPAELGRLHATEEWAPNHRPLACELAANGTATASGSWNADVPRNAVDHDDSTLWQSAQSEQAWLQVDLGRTQIIDAMVMNWGWDLQLGPDAQSTVMTSLDGLQWSFLYSLISTASHRDVPQRVWFPERVARYVRIIGTRWNGGPAHVRSFELYGLDCTLKPEPRPRRSYDQLMEDARPQRHPPPAQGTIIF